MKLTMLELMIERDKLLGMAKAPGDALEVAFIAGAVRALEWAAGHESLAPSRTIHESKGENDEAGRDG